MLRPLALAALGLSMLLTACSKSGDETPQLPEKQVTFYTTYGYLDGDNWTIPMRIWVHEEPDAARRLLATQARKELLERSELGPLSGEQEDRYMSRAHGFIADSESRERIQFLFDGDPQQQLFELHDAEGETGTDRNGNIEGEIMLSAARARELLDAQNSTEGWLSFRAASKDHGGSGRLRLIPGDGVSIISDIDDTIKVTNIPAGSAEVIRNTFFLEFVAAPCMPDMNEELGADTAFHYVSGGPWQLYQPLTDFLQAVHTGYPQGSYHMKNVRTNLSESESYTDLWKLMAGGSKQVTFEQKVGQIGTLLSHFPNRRFVLIGDSGEKDPEVFAAIREQYAEQVQEIRIRDVVDDVSNNPERLAGMTIITPNPAPGGNCIDTG